MIAACVAEEFAIHVGRRKGEERRILPFDRREVSIAGLAVLRLYRRQFRQCDQDLTNSLDDLLLFCRGKLGQVERLILHFNLAGAA
jgi:hypothetical protein